MFLLNQIERKEMYDEVEDLHPIMFLLNQMYDEVEVISHVNLHPIMFLLNPADFRTM